MPSPSNPPSDPPSQQVIIEPSVSARESILYRLPTDLLCQVHQQMDFEDLQRLRLTSRVMNLNIVSNSFTFIKKGHHRVKALTLTLVPSEIRALEHFAKGPFAAEVTRLTLKKTDFQTFKRDVDDTVAQQGLGQGSFRPRSSTRLMMTRKAGSPRDAQELYQDVLAWAGPNLHSLLPNVTRVDYICPQSLKATEAGQEITVETMKWTLSWDFLFLEHLLSKMVRPLELRVQAYELFECKITDLSILPEIQIKGYIGPLQSHNCDIQAATLTIFCCYLHDDLLSEPVTHLALDETYFDLLHLQSIMTALSPPSTLEINHGQLCFDDLIENDLPVTNKQAIEHLVAILRPNLHRLRLRHVASQLQYADTRPHMAHLLRTLKKCDKLEEIDV
ncbi:hypothetical protein HDK64DRAFT_302120 [Phyllosticta capitalensis]